MPIDFVGSILENQIYKKLKASHPTQGGGYNTLHIDFLNIDSFYKFQRLPKIEESGLFILFQNVMKSIGLLH